MKAFRKSWVFSLAFLLILGLGCSSKSNQTAADADGGKTSERRVLLSGTVNTNGASPEGVLITAASIDYIPGQSSSGLYTTQTNSEGYYAMTVPMGVYNVTAEGVGLQKAARSKVRLSGTTTLDFVLTATGDLTGRISYHQSPQEGIVVFLYGTQFMAITDQNGSYSLRGIPIGSYRLGIIIPDEDGGALPVADEVVIEAGKTKDLGILDGYTLERFAFIDYLDPGKIETSHDPDHPIIIHRYELFDECMSENQGILVKFQREMDAKSVEEAIQIEAPPQFAARNLRWKYEWGYYQTYQQEHWDSETESHQFITKRRFYPSACHLLITPQDENGQLAVKSMPAGKYVIRLATSAKDKCGHPLYRACAYSFEIREMMRWAVNDHFLPNGASGVDVGGGIQAQFTNLIDHNSLDLSAVVIAPELSGKEVLWTENNLLIRGRYAEGTSYTITLPAGIKTIYGDPIIDAAEPDSNTISIQFTTASPRVAAMLPKPDSQGYGIHEPVTLIFNTITDRDSVEQHIKVYAETAAGGSVEIPVWQDANSPSPSYKLLWANPPEENSSNFYPSYYEKCEGCGPGSECDEVCPKNLGDHLLISFPRQYGHTYRVELDGNAVSSMGSKIAAFSGSFKTKVPCLVDQNIRDGETITDLNIENLWFRYNVPIDISEANIILATEDEENILLGIKPWHSELYLIPKSLPHSTHFILTLQNIKADDGSPIPDQTIKFSTPGLTVVESLPWHGQIGYILEPDGRNNFVNIKFNGQLTKEMQQAIKDTTRVIGSIYGPDVDPSSLPANYPPPMFIWCNWKFGWTQLQIAFTMDPCTNYKIQWDRNSTATSWLPQDIVFSTACPQDEPMMVKLLYRTEPENGSRGVDLYSNVNLYFAVPGIQEYYGPYRVNLEVWAGETKLNRYNDYNITFSPYEWDCPMGQKDPWGNWRCDESTSTNVSHLILSFSHLKPNTTYKIEVTDIYSDPCYSGSMPSLPPLEWNIPYTYTFTTGAPKIEIEADNKAGELIFKADEGYFFRTSDLKDPNIVSIQPNLRDGGKWEFYGNPNDSTNDPTYATQAILHYRPTNYALIKVQILKGMDCFAPADEGGSWNLIGQFGNTPGKWVLQVEPDIVLPKLERVEQVGGDRYNFIRLFFNVDLDSATALDPNKYQISYIDGNGAVKSLGVQRALDYSCLQNNGWDPNRCDPSLAPPRIGQDGQVVLKTDPQENNVEYTLRVSGVKSYSLRYEIVPENGLAKFRGRAYTGRVMEATCLETIDDIRNTDGDLLDGYLSSWDSWKMRAKKIAIRFDLPMDPNTVSLGENVVITPYGSSTSPSWIDCRWYNDNTIMVITYLYQGTDNGYGGYYNNYPPSNFTINVGETCRNAKGEKLTNTPTSFWAYSYNPIILSPSAQLILDSTTDPNNPSATVEIDYSYLYGVPEDAAQLAGNYQLVDPNRINAASGAPISVLDCAGNPVVVESVDTSGWPGRCVLKLSKPPTNERVWLVLSGIPNSSMMPSWFPREALGDTGACSLWYQPPACGQPPVPPPPAGTAPTVSIVSPTEGQTFSPGDIITLEASISDPDPEDATFPSEKVVWKDETNGQQIGNGTTCSGTIPSDISPGLHQITVTVTDSQGHVVSASVNINVL